MPLLMSGALHDQTSETACLLVCRQTCSDGHAPELVSQQHDRRSRHASLFYNSAQLTPCLWM